MSIKSDTEAEMRRNPINREKYVRDKLRYNSKAKAVRIQKPYLSPQNAGVVARKLDEEPVVQRLSQGIEQAMIDLNAKRLLKINYHMDSDDEKVSLDAAKEAGKTINHYMDRTLGKAKQSIEVKSTKLIISLNMADEAMTIAPEVIDYKEEVLLEAEADQ